MAGNELRHLAIIAEGALDPALEAGRAVVDALGRAAATATEAFAAVTGLRAFSFFAPELDALLEDPLRAPAASGACLEGRRLLEEAASRSGAALRLCGRTEGLPGELARRDSPGEGRQVLWYLRYRGRDEIARAAERFLRANPGRALGDDEFDAWLDTAGTPDPDLIVLAGGELEVKDALLWQGSYAELWHTPRPWTRFSGEDLKLALASYDERQRRFGRSQTG